MKKAIKSTLKQSKVFLWMLMVIISGCTQKNITVWVASPWQRVIRDTPPVENKAVSLKAAANEYEPFRIIVHNGSKINLVNVDVTVSNLKSSDGEISAGNIKLFRAHYLNIYKPSYRTNNPVGWYPDALIPFMDLQADKAASINTYIANPFMVDTAQNAEVWCDLFVPPGTKPGVYKGNLTVTADKRKLASIPINLTVWGFELPAKIAMISHFGGLNWESNRIQATSVKLMGIEMNTPEFTEMEKLYNSELLKHRAVPASPSNIWPEWNEKDGIIENGETERIKELVDKEHFNTLNIPFRFRDDPKKCKLYLASTAEWLSKLGYLDISYMYLEDEPNDAKEYELVRKQGALIKSANPGIKRLCTEQTISSNKAWGDLYGAVDIWCPIWGLWNDSTAKVRLAKGEKLWSYTALCQGPEGTPWWQIDMEPLNFRSPMWISWHYDITGFLYWASISWRTATKPEDVWEAPYFRKQLFWGEGCLLYPGQPAGIKGFVPSIRLKLYREAAEDYEYMVIAAKLGYGNEVNKIVDGIATSFQKWSHERNAYEQGREQLAELILKGRK
jgi:hypothetical protein